MSELNYEELANTVIADLSKKLANETMKKKLENTDYFKSYFAFLDYFKEIKKSEKITEQEFLIAAHFTYGWMPTIPTLHGENYGASIDVLNKVIKNESLKDTDYKTLKDCINNSIVGASKLIHFIQPEIYPIIDSRIMNYFRLHKKTGLSSFSKDNAVKKYMTYKELCDTIIGIENKKPTNKSILARTKEILKDYSEKSLKSNMNDLTDMRVLENLFFCFGKKTKKDETQK